MSAPRTVSVRSYRGVLDSVERRFYRIDQWRLPNPEGVSVKAVVYFLCCLVVVALAGHLPLVGAGLDLLTPALRYLGLPIVGAWALSALRIDGRRPHHALVSIARHRLRARTLAGLRPAPQVGTRIAPVAAVQVAAIGDGPRYRRGRVRGPARLVVRYPAELRPGRGSRRRLTVAALGSRSRPLPVGRALRVPEGGEVRFR